MAWRRDSQDRLAFTILFQVDNDKQQQVEQMRRKACSVSGKEFKVSIRKNEEKRVAVLRRQAPPRTSRLLSTGVAGKVLLKAEPHPLKKTSWENPNSSK